MMRGWLFPAAKRCLDPSIALGAERLVWRFPNAMLTILRRLANTFDGGRVIA
ncbi:MAG TPA: hypothetical protein VFE47_30900 [Tepidisphaeraceae bacterium]|jgi:hypothetical protein|nr:hypothetical protein [Tepidisphaeraceae bacterium]